jgi:flavin reductase
VEKRGKFGVNVLKEDQEELGAYFARRPADRSGNVSYTYSQSENGTPILNESMVFFDCKVIGSHVYGDHTIYLGEVKGVRQEVEGTPLMFYQSRWYHPARD